MDKRIELVEKVSNNDGSQLVTAELNCYEAEVYICQLSRTEFLLPELMTDEEIITHLSINDYSRYL